MIIFFSFEQSKYVEMKDGKFIISEDCPPKMKGEIQKVIDKMERLANIETLEEYEDMIYEDDR